MEQFKNAKTNLWSKLQILENFKVKSDQSKNFSSFKINEIQNSNEASESKLRTCPSKIDGYALGPCGSPKNFIWSSFEFILGEIPSKMMILTNVTFGLWCFGATNAWLKNGYWWIKNDIFELKWSEYYKNHALRITFWVRYYFDRNKITRKDH